MKTKLLVTAFVVLSMALTTGSSSAADIKPTLVLRLGHTHTPDMDFDSVHIVSAKFQELLKPQGIDVKIFPAAQLGGDRDMQEQMALGSLDINVTGTATVADKFAPIAVLDLPYLWKDYDHVHKVVDGPIGKDLSERLLKATGMRILAFPDSFGFRNVATVSKPLRTLADMKNVKIRTIGTPTYIGTFKALGASPVAMGFGEVYTSMQTGVIDGWEHEPPTLFTSKTYEVAKYVTKTDHLYGVLIFLMSDKSWQKIAVPQQQIIMKAAQDATDYERKLVSEKTKQMYKALQDKGMTIIDIDKAPLIAATKEFRENWVKENGVQDIYKQILSQ